MQHLAWRKSSFSGPNSDDCVEVAHLPGGGRAIRDSKNPNGPILELTPVQWAAFLLGVKDGELG
jgi:hypothetical protein